MKCEVAVLYPITVASVKDKKKQVGVCYPTVAGKA